MIVEFYRKIEGFTFLELIAVVLLLSTLASLAMLNYFDLQQATTRELVKTDLKILRAALRSYYLAKGTFPTELNQLQTEKIMAEIPVDKFSTAGGTPYHYQQSSVSSAKLWSVGPNQLNNSGALDDEVLQITP